MFSILVAEDDRNLNRMICAKLKQEGYHAFPAFDGEAGFFVSRGKGLWGTGRELGNRHVDGGMTGERGYVAEKLCI